MNETPDIILMTDGSGYRDGYGGWAAVAFTPDGIWKYFRMGGASGTTVDRMEFTAMLEGLQLAWEMWVAMPGSSSCGYKPVVQLKSDRENLVLSAKMVQERSNSPDLWRRFSYYEEMMEIRPWFVDEIEEKVPDFKIVDVQASYGRTLLKHWLENLEFLPPSLLPGQGGGY